MTATTTTRSKGVAPRPRAGGGGVRACVGAERSGRAKTAPLRPRSRRCFSPVRRCRRAPQMQTRRGGFAAPGSVVSTFKGKAHAWGQDACRRSSGPCSCARRGGDRQALHTVSLRLNSNSCACVCQCEAGVVLPYLLCLLRCGAPLFKAAAACAHSFGPDSGGGGSQRSQSGLSTPRISRTGPATPRHVSVPHARPCRLSCTPANAGVRSAQTAARALRSAQAGLGLRSRARNGRHTAARRGATHRPRLDGVHGPKAVRLALPAAPRHATQPRALPKARHRSHNVENCAGGARSTQRKLSRSSGVAWRGLRTSLGLSAEAFGCCRRCGSGCAAHAGVLQRARRAQQRRAHGDPRTRSASGGVECTARWWGARTCTDADGLTPVRVVTTRAHERGSTARMSVGVSRVRVRRGLRLQSSCLRVPLRLPGKITRRVRPGTGRALFALLRQCRRVGGQRVKPRASRAPCCQQL